MSGILSGALGAALVTGAVVATVAGGLATPATATGVVLADPPFAQVDPAASGQQTVGTPDVQDYIVTFTDPTLTADGEDTGTYRLSSTASPVDADDLVVHDGIVDVEPVMPGHAVVSSLLDEHELEQLPGVADAELNDPRYLFDDQYHLQWPLKNTQTPGADIRWEEARELSTGAGVVVAVIDTGIDTTHPDLASQMWFNPGEICGNGLDDDGNGYRDDCNGWDFANNDPSVNDANADNSHGTHVAGIIAGNDNRDGVAGVADGAEIMSLKIFHNGASSSALLAAAINYAVDNGADVINMSLGGQQGTSLEYNALRRANAAGIAVIAAAGNDRKNNDAYPTYPANYDLPVILAVASSNSSDQHSSQFSNYGRTKVDLHAPGEQILSALPGRRAGYMSGTSMATPYASGVAALVVAQGVRGADVRQTLMDTARPLPGLQGLTVTGARLDAAAAAGAGRARGREPEILFRSFHDATAGVGEDAQVHISADLEAMEVGRLALRGTLGAVHGSELYGVADFDLLADGHQVTTDELGAFDLTAAPFGTARQTELSSGISVPLAYDLPAGDYALMVESLDADDPDGGPVVEPAVVFFRIEPEAGEATPSPGDGGTGGSPDSGDGSSGGGSNGDTGGGTDGNTGGGSSGGSTDGGSGGGNTGGGNTGGSPGIVIGPGPGDGGGSTGGGTGDSTGGSTGGGTGGSTGGSSGGSTGGNTGGGSSGGSTGGNTGGGGSGDGSTGGGSGPIVSLPPGGGSGGDTGGGSSGGSTGGSTGGGSGSGGGSTGGDTTPPPDGGDQEVSGTVSPSAGRPSQTMVSVTVPSGIPSNAYVHFGSSNAQVISRSGSTRVTVQPPAHVPGTVDVVIIADGQRRVIRNGYTYLPAEGSTTPPGEDGGGGSTTPPDSGGSTTPPEDGSGGGSTTPPGGGGTSPDDGSAEPAPGPGGPVEHEGLTLNPFPEGHPLADVTPSRVASQRCTQESCAARRP